MTVAELLEVLRITKQSLSRVLKQLIDTGHVVQATGQHDRRHRKLYPTKSGRQLTLALALPQSRRIARALEDCAQQDRKVIERFSITWSIPSAGRRSTSFLPPLIELIQKRIHAGSE